MNLDNRIIMETEPTEPAEVVAIEQTPEAYYVYLCVGKIIVAPEVIVDEAQGTMFCRINDNKGITRFEYPLADKVRLRYI